MDTMKREIEEPTGQEDFKRFKTENGLDALASVSAANTMTATIDSEGITTKPVTKARENRLEQNRKAARESRRRKKLMIEGKFLTVNCASDLALDILASHTHLFMLSSPQSSELQRSVIFFSKANGTLKMQNEELGRRFAEAQTRVAAIEASKASESQPQPEVPQKQIEPRAPAQSLNEQVQAHAVATQALYESQGFPAGAARAAAQAMNASTPAPEQKISITSPPVNGVVPPMQPGATMQAMAAFQQAAAAAMQAAMGMNPAANPQQVYADAINAFAQQAGQVQFQQGMQFMGFPPAMPMAMMWQQPSKPSMEVPQQVTQQPEQQS